MARPVVSTRPAPSSHLVGSSSSQTCAHSTSRSRPLPPASTVMPRCDVEAISPTVSPIRVLPSAQVKRQGLEHRTCLFGTHHRRSRARPCASAQETGCSLGKLPIDEPIQESLASRATGTGSPARFGVVLAARGWLCSRGGGPVTLVVRHRQALIDGGWAEGGDGVIEVRSPHSGEVVGTVTRCTAAQVDRAVQAARSAFPQWKQVPLLDRVDLLYRAHALCRQRNEAIARQISLEMGKTIRESREEMVEYACEHFRRAAEDVLRYRGQFLPSTQERTNNKRIVVSQEPAG